MGWYGADLHVVHPGCKYKSNQPLYLQLTSSKLICDEIKNIPYSLKKSFPPLNRKVHWKVHQFVTFGGYLNCKGKKVVLAPWPGT